MLGMADRSVNADWVVIGKGRKHLSWSLVELTTLLWFVMLLVVATTRLRFDVQWGAQHQR